MIEKEDLLRKMEEKNEELDYLNKKVIKIEQENKSIRLNRGQDKKIKELEEEVEHLKSQASKGYKIE
eukprot:CAMPEP_0170567526 /NCGR_PEP_ID=MMETSP0211-20121228/80535_1 /TAXON_ID=311385 /ORGANISM="Pseudokeronopsis sp., Strain OXSARD2" /LENGTH=66 /DNA_ID=CAMNT_0010889009 /DNA_START=76 /DNA_END=276 /DNA_ORIENTATION=-